MKNTERIDNYLKENNLSKTKFCKQCGVSYSVFNKLYKSDLKIKITSLRKIANCLGVSVITLLQDFDDN